MDLIWNIAQAFGLVSLFLLVVCIWTHLDMRKKQRQEESDANKVEKKQ
jgi:cbb3-type cytochrome oxidase subunit 3